MGATCIGLVEEVDALGGVVHCPVEERPENKVFERCSFRNWYMVLGLHRGPVEGRQGCRDAVIAWQGCSNSLVRRDAVIACMQGCRKSPAVKSPAGTIRRYSPNETGVQGGRPARSLRSSESAVTDEGKRDNRCERMFLREGQSSPGNLKTTGFPHSLLEEHQDLALLRSAQPVPQDWTTSTSGEQCRTQVPVSAGSGDLRPTLDEENAPPLVQDQCAALHYIQQRYTVLVNVVTKFLVTWSTTKFLATLPTIKCLEHASTVCFNNYSSWFFYEASSTIHGGSSMHTMVMTTIVSNTKGPTIFPLGVLSTANRLDSLLAAWP